MVNEKQEQGIQQPISRAEFEKLYGPMVKAHAVEFTDGRTVQVEEFETAYILRCFNAKNDPPSHYTYVTLSREAMYATYLLYAWPRINDGIGRDETAMREHLTDEHLAFIDETKAETISQVESSHLRERERLRDACKAALRFLETFRVPQTKEQAALQLIQGGPVVDGLRAALETDGGEG